MPFTPFLHFQGTCAAAMRFYADVFGADEVQMTSYAEMPPGSGMPASDLVMYAHIRVGSAYLMASDFPPGQPGDPQKAVTVAWTVPDAAAGQALYDRLCDGGAPIMPFGPTFWSSAFGMLRDRFGTHWMLSVDDTKAP